MSFLIDYKKFSNEPYRPLAPYARLAAAEGCVLLKNEGDILPIGRKSTISLFGRTQIDYNKSGTGSGGLVRTQYAVNILEGIKNNEKLTLNDDLIKVYKSWIKENPFDEGEGWAMEPWCQKEMVPSEEIVAAAREKSDIAVIVIGRTAGEDKDNSAEKGSWYLTDEEEDLLRIVSKYFEKTVVLLNVGNIIDMKWVEKYNIKSVMYIWQGGQEGGNAVADVLCGDVNPSGRLTDTIAKDISLYPSIKNFGNTDFNIYEEDIYVGYRYFETFAPDDVLYPFGFGLSYTSFEKTVKNVDEYKNKITFDVEVKNTGKYKGREVIEVYFEAPQGKLGKSVRELSAFAKTKAIEPGECDILHFELDVLSMNCYDDSGATGNKSCYILEEGDYNIYVGDSVRSAEKVYTHNVASLVIVKRCTEALAPVRDFNVMYPEKENGKYKAAYKPVSKRTIDYSGRIKADMPREIEYTGDRGIKLVDVKNRKNTIEEFVAQIPDEELMCLARGEGMCSPKIRAGCAGAIGGVTEALSKFGIPVGAFCDGPSGIRMDSGEFATSLPNGTGIACTWDLDLAEQLYEGVSIELLSHDIDSLLGPGANIHRVPLNGRNFEYFSEDPYISGKFAAAMVKGIKTFGNSATIKHFAANSQEFHRRDVDSVMSERAAREIYLRSFEYAVKEAKATSLMTSYNPINGIWSPNNYELNTVILRGEWGYGGFVMTDWWPRLSEKEDDCMNLKNMVEAQNDVYMPTPDSYTFCDNLKEALKNGEITRAQLQRNAINILKYLANSHALERFVESENKFEKSLMYSEDELDTSFEIVSPESEKEYQLDLKEKGMYLLCIEYTSSQPEISQMVISVSMNSVSAAQVTVNGTNGGKKTVHRDISVVYSDGKIKIKYPEKLLTITKIEFKK